MQGHAAGKGAGQRRRVRVAIAAVLAASIAALPACRSSAQETGDATDTQQNPTAALVRGAEPGGMTDSWVEKGGGRSLDLDEDGRAIWRDGDDATSGTWLMSGPSDGEVMLSDGRTLVLSLDEERNHLSAEVIEQGHDGREVTLVRAPADGGDAAGDGKSD